MSEPARELKAVSLRFRNLASQAIRSNSDDARVNLRRLLTFVNDTRCLREQVDRAPTPPIDVLELWKHTQEQRDRLEFPDDALEELGLLHALLTALSQPSTEEFWRTCYWYGGVHDMKECVREVLYDTCGRYTAQLREVIEMALLHSDDPAYDSRRVEIHVSGGQNQVNVAHDHAHIAADMSIGETAQSVAMFARELAALAATAARETGSDEARELEAAATAIVETMQQPEPNKFTLHGAIEGISAFGKVVHSVSVLAPYAERLIHHSQMLVAQVATWGHTLSP